MVTVTAVAGGGIAKPQRKSKFKAPPAQMTVRA
jgi:hypothetical protein